MDQNAGRMSSAWLCQMTMSDNSDNGRSVPYLNVVGEDGSHLVHELDVGYWHLEVCIDALDVLMVAAVLQGKR